MPIKQGFSHDEKCECATEKECKCACKGELHGNSIKKIVDDICKQFPKYTSGACIPSTKAIYKKLKNNNIDSEIVKVTVKSKIGEFISTGGHFATYLKNKNIIINCAYSQFDKQIPELKELNKYIFTKEEYEKLGFEIE